MIQVHATCIEMDGAAVLLRGPPGSGKSDLALRLVDAGGRLVADDQVRLDTVAGTLVASAPPSICGRIEVRGVGVITLPEERLAPDSPVMLVADLVDKSVERLPEPAHCSLAGVEVPVIRMAPFEASAPAKLRLALRAHAQEHCLKAEGEA